MVRILLMLIIAISMTVFVLHAQLPYTPLTMNEPLDVSGELLSSHGFGDAAADAGPGGPHGAAVSCETLLKERGRIGLLAFLNEPQRRCSIPSARAFRPERSGADDDDDGVGLLERERRLPDDAHDHVCLSQGRRAAWTSSECMLSGPVTIMSAKVVALYAEGCLALEPLEAASSQETGSPSRDLKMPCVLKTYEGRFREDWESFWVDGLKSTGASRLCHERGRHINTLVAAFPGVVVLEAVGPSADDLVSARLPTTMTRVALRGATGAGICRLVHFVLRMMADVALATSHGWEAGRMFHGDMKEPNVALSLRSGQTAAGTSSAWPWPPELHSQPSLKDDMLDHPSWVLIDWDSAEPHELLCEPPGPVTGTEDPPSSDEGDLTSGFHYGCQLGKAAITLLVNLGRDLPDFRNCMAEGYEDFPKRYMSELDELSGDKHPCLERRHLFRLQALVPPLRRCLLPQGDAVAPGLDSGDGCGGGEENSEAALLMHAIDELVGRTGAKCRSWLDWVRFFERNESLA